MLCDNGLESQKHEGRCLTESALLTSAGSAPVIRIRSDPVEYAPGPDLAYPSLS